jgi:hypothetical protein
MGWTGIPGIDKAGLVKECLSGCSPYTVQDHSLNGNELWVLMAKPGEKPLIVLFLLSGTGGMWGYKDMDESMGPYYVKCPLKFLALAPSVNEEWRAKVRAYHAGKTAKAKLKKGLQVGQTVIFRPGVTCMGSPLSEAVIERLKPLCVRVGFSTVRVKLPHILGVKEAV